MIRLALLRHGHTSWNREGRIQGHTNISLPADVMDDLSAYSLPQPWHAARLVSSPLSRAVQTAELVAGREPETVDALVEMNWGDWEGLRSVDLGADQSSGFRHVDQWGWGFRPPNGESPGEVRARLEPWWRGLQQDTVAVCHIGIMRTLLATAHSWDFLGPAPFEVKRKRLYILDVGESLAIAEPACVRLLGRTQGKG